MDEKDALRLLRAAGAIVTESHIVYKSGLHGSTYVNKDALYPHTREVMRCCSAIAGWFAGDRVDAVIAPAVGGVILSQWTAFNLTAMAGREVLSVYAEKDGDGFAVRRGYDKLVMGKRLLVVEDVLTTGSSVASVIHAVRSLGGYVVGVGALCNRGRVTAESVGDIPRLIALVNTPLEAWNEDACPLCTRGVPVNTDVGHGREFLARKTERGLR